MALPLFTEEARLWLQEWPPHKKRMQRRMSHYFVISKINLPGKNDQSLLKAYASSYMEKYNWDI